jgi:hypothetical protein
VGLLPSSKPGLHRSARSERGAPASEEHAQVTRSLTRGGVALLANSGLTAALGVAFWLVAARLLTTTTVGRGSALVAALLTVSGLSQVNYARALSGLLPQAHRPRRLLARVYGITVGLSFVVGLASALVLPKISKDFTYVRGDVVFIAIFAVSVGLWTIFNLEDAALTSVRRATIVPFENGTYGVLKLVCLVALWHVGDRGSLAVFIAWVLPLIAVIIPVNLFLYLRAVPASAARPAEPMRRSPPWLRYDFVGYLLWLAGTLPLPVLVLITAGAANSASFYVCFTIASAIDLLCLMLGNSLTAELSRTDGMMTPATRSHLLRVWAAVGFLAVVIFAVAPEVLQVFGDKYKAAGSIVLRIFMIATLPRSVLFMGIAIQRSRGNGPAILLLQAIASVGTLGLGLALARSLGAPGITVGWLVASCAAALVSMLFLGRGGWRGRGSRRAPRPGLAERVPWVAELPGFNLLVTRQSARRRALGPAQAMATVASQGDGLPDEQARSGDVMPRPVVMWEPSGDTMPLPVVMWDSSNK